MFRVKSQWGDFAGRVDQVWIVEEPGIKLATEQGLIGPDYIYKLKGGYSGREVLLASFDDYNAVKRIINAIIDTAKKEVLVDIAVLIEADDA
ncbi:MAG: hypothetical protein ACM3UZ_05850 [Acidobacteriota bacterium]